jgi:hypothetical protein
MNEKTNSLERLYVASPCSADWDAMPGNEQVRFCNQCNLNVYNLSAMTRQQAEEIIAKTEGRLCTKFYRRADGTILTNNCPIGFQAFRRRVSHIASATLSALLGFFTNQTIVLADDAHNNCIHYKATITRLESQANSVEMRGTVTDTINAVVPNAKITLIHEESKREFHTTTDAEGKYRFSSLQMGSYAIAVWSPGFTTFKKKGFKVKDGELLQLDVTLQVGSVGGAAFLPNVPERGKGLKTSPSA